MKKDIFQAFEELDEKLSQTFSSTIYKPENLNKYVVSIKDNIDIKEEDTPLYKHQQQIKEIIENIKELLKLKSKEIDEMQKESKKLKRQFFITLVMSLIAIIISVLAWLFPNIDIKEIIGMLTK